MSLPDVDKELEARLVLHDVLYQMYVEGSDDPSDYYEAVRGYEGESGVHFNGSITISETDHGLPVSIGMSLCVGTRTEIMYGAVVTTNHVKGDVTTSIVTIIDVSDSNSIYESLSCGCEVGETVYIGEFEFARCLHREPRMITYGAIRNGHFIAIQYSGGDLYLEIDEEFYAEVDSGEKLLSLLSEITKL